ncbi:MAG: CBS domain-containing protein [Alphaproteobacteria bacterium]|nr:CBS domain-containing protein [Alphaproteobacteria bacterium]
MTVAAILKHKGYEVLSVNPTASIAEVVDTLSRRRIGAVVVIDAADQLLGIVSERDIMNSLAANGPRTLEMSAGQLMTRVLHTVTPQTTEVEAMTMMTASRVRHLPVIEHGALIGMISIGDVVKARIMQQDQEVDSLKAYVAGAT